MLPTIASGSGGQKNRIPRRAPRVADVRRLDAALFASSGWFAIDARNQRVPGVVVASLEAGLELVGRGSVATIVGRLRPEVVVVDVDLAGESGWAVTESLSQWCAREGLWHLVRPSGGAEGRCHVFIAPQARREALEAFLDGLRRSNPGGRTSIDLRTSVRPLSAPHRTGAHTSPFEADVALSRLEAQPWHTAPASAPRRPPSKQTKRRRPPVAALEPTRRREHRALPAAWKHFLDTGERPPLREPAPGAPAHTRSTWEAIATASMVRAGWSAEQAWEAIQKAHPHAMDHARADRRRWVQWVWNRAVLDDADYQPPRPPLDPRVAAAVDQARTRLRTIGWSLSLRRRHAVLLVGHALLDRMSRTGLLRVPCPERNLLLDTGLTDRKTIRAALRLLDGELGQLYRCFDPKDRESSSFEFEIASSTTEGTGVRQIPPPSCHTPLPSALPPNTPHACAHLLRALQTLPAPAPLAEVSFQAQLTSSPTTDLSPCQIRAARSALAHLARLGLAWCTEEGLWVARHEYEASAQAVGQERHEQLSQMVQQERAAYRASGGTAWNVARAAALKADRARQQAWWAGLSGAERRARTATWQGRFARLSVAEQAAVKGALVERDRRGGIDASARHDAWLDGLDSASLVARSVDRAAWYAALSPPLQVAYARAWQAHRERFGIRRGTPASATSRELALSLPDSSRARDESFAQAQLPGFGRRANAG